MDEVLELPSRKNSRAWLASLPQKHWEFKSATARPARQRFRTFVIKRTGRWRLAQEAPDCGPADTVGPWRLIQKIGEGGMAEVWMAERSDGLLARPVALKLPRKGWGNLVLSPASPGA